MGFKSREQINAEKAARYEKAEVLRLTDENDAPGMRSALKAKSAGGVLMRNARMDKTEAHLKEHPEDYEARAGLEVAKADMFMPDEFVVRDVRAILMAGRAAERMAPLKEEHREEVRDIVEGHDDTFAKFVRHYAEPLANGEPIGEEAYNAVRTDLAEALQAEHPSFLGEDVLDELYDTEIVADFEKPRLAFPAQLALTDQKASDLADAGLAEFKPGNTVAARDLYGKGTNGGRALAEAYLPEVEKYASFIQALDTVEEERQASLPPLRVPDAKGSHAVFYDPGTLTKEDRYQVYEKLVRERQVTNIAVLSTGGNMDENIESLRAMLPGRRIVPFDGERVEALESSTRTRLVNGVAKGTATVYGRTNDPTADVAAFFKVPVPEKEAAAARAQGAER